MITWLKKYGNLEKRLGIPHAPAIVATDSFFYPNGDKKRTWPIESKASYYSGHADWLQSFQGLFVIDIEHLDLTDPQSIEHLKYAVLLYRLRNPGLRIGFYSLMPERAWYPATLPGQKTQRAEWRKRNAALRSGARSLASVADFVMPSLYLPHAAEAGGLRAFVQANLHEAAKYDKPIIPSLWPFWEGDRGQLYIGDVLVRELVATVDAAECCEGVFWWEQSNRVEPDSFVKTLGSLAA